MISSADRLAIEAELATPTGQVDLGALFIQALENDVVYGGVDPTVPSFRWVFQPQYSAVGRPKAVVSSLRIDLGDGGPWLQPKHGLIQAIDRCVPGQLGDLEATGIYSALEATNALRLQVRTTVSPSVSPDFVAAAIVIGAAASVINVTFRITADSSSLSDQMSLAKHVAASGGEFSFANVLNQEHAEMLLAMSQMEGVKPKAIDVDYRIASAIDSNVRINGIAKNALRLTFAVAKQYDVDVVLPGLGSPHARALAFDAAALAQFPTDRLSMTGSDMGPAFAFDGQAQRIPRLLVNPTTGEIGSLGIV